ncbi:MAG: rare lipoprotein [Thermoleophilaceae bacterium]|nr:rare lipoprotein [Thermoleophilaceae bacterium]
MRARILLLTLSLVLCLTAAVPASAAVLGSRTLERGDRGWDVVTLQRVLALQGFSAGSADGIFGRMTARSVRRFQRSRGLGVDGRVGPVTTHTLALGWRLRTASWYGPGLWGNRTACGQVLRPGTRGVAHKTLPCGTRVAIYANGRIAIFPVIDRGPYVDGVFLDLTAAAARSLRITENTTVRDRLAG